VHGGAARNICQSEARLRKAEALQWVNVAAMGLDSSQGKQGQNSMPHP
jgi:hypothetical protein